MYVKDIEDGVEQKCVCMLFSIFDIFDIHSITALMCIWSIFDIFDMYALIYSASQNFLRIENWLTFKKVMSKNVCVCSFPIFDIFNIHSITALRCIWSIFDVFDIDSITFKENENNIFNMSHTL